jgi:DNA-directed RNA polymerase specialized sigma24 family protein
MSVDLRPDEVVYEAHARELVRFAAGLVGPADAADVVADAFVRVVASPVWTEARDRRALWFRAVTFEARSLQRSAMRRRAREASVAAADTNSISPGPMLGDERVQDALDVLSVQQRAAVVLTYWQDLGPGDVAKLLGVTEGSVRKQLARARKKLRGALV